MKNISLSSSAKLNNQAYIIILLLLIVLLFSPLLSYFFCIIAYWIFGSSMSSGGKKTIATLFSTSFALIISSGSFGFFGKADDFVNYYNDYLSIANNSETFSQVLMLYTSGIEFGLPLLFYVLAILFPILTPVQLMFLLSFLVSLAFALWVIKHGCQEFEASKNSGYIIALSLSLLSIAIGTQLLRQGFSCVILLFALSQKNTTPRYALLLVAMAFHLTALPLFFIVKFVIRYKWKSHLVLGPLVIATFFLFGNLLSALQDLPKFAYFARQEFDQISETDIGTLKWVLVGLFFSIIGIVTRKKAFVNNFNGIIGGWPLAVFFVLLFVALIRIPLLPTRMTMIFGLILLGYFTAISTLGSRLSFLQATSIVSILIFKFSTIFPMVPVSERYLWFNYDWIGILPAYYLFQS
jgi:hypothetical protein